MTDALLKLTEAFRAWAGETCQDPIPLPSSGSERIYWRLAGRSASAIGVFHPVREESIAFLEFTRHFHSKGLNVPEIYYSDLLNNVYLLQDLGDTTLFSLLGGVKDMPLKPNIHSFYEKALEELVRFQVLGGEGLNYGLCYPRGSFDRQSLIWDLNYFKYDFLKLQLNFNEQKLEEDFGRLMDFLLEAPADHFMYRDFQSRNIMVHNNTLYFIDYQGGRRGPLQYDPISLLFQVKAGIPASERESLLGHYLDIASTHLEFDRGNFMKHYDSFVLLRLLQVFGAYGFRGLVQKKQHFVTSLPYAVSTLIWFLENRKVPVGIPELMRCLKEIAYSGKFALPDETHHGKLTIALTSFSYKNGFPEDHSGHGGGFIFDCRALPNPGREESMRKFNGKDSVIVNWLKGKEEVIAFLQNIFLVIDRSAENYLSRGFGHLSVAFGCTGGQHRSVYCTEALARHLKNKFPDVIVKVRHRELEIE